MKKDKNLKNKCNKNKVILLCKYLELAEYEEVFKERE